MIIEEILSREDFKACARFHGHICPGLTIGYRAARAGLEKLKEIRSVDEEIVAITETDACCADAIQVLTGCTFGKGNLIYKDYGKMVFLFFSRKSGKGVRFSLIPGSLDDPAAAGGTAAFNLQKEKDFPEFQPEKTRYILTRPLEELFAIKDVQVELPPKAKIESSILCDMCKEPVIPSKIKKMNGSNVCQECFH
jgi:formylmethanofuran dehydrogenase subunit E